VTRQIDTRKAHGAAQAGRLGKPGNAAGADLPRSPCGPGRPKALGKARRAARAGRPGKRRNAAQRLRTPRREPPRSV